MLPCCFEPNELVKYYPRGEKELRGPFHQFSSGDTIVLKTWRRTKTEDDGCFPFLIPPKLLSNVFLRYSKLGIEVLTGQSVQSLFKKRQYGK
jgi:predicted flavoprotein YhiN